MPKPALVSNPALRPVDKPSRSPLAMLVALLAAALMLQGCLLLRTRPMGEGIGVSSDDLPQVAELEGEKVYSLIQPDRIPAIDAPELVPASEADFMAPEELILGVVRDGIAKAYSLWHLDRHEIVNDWLGEAPIAATW